MTLSKLSALPYDQLPPAYQNVQFNYCKTVSCQHFGDPNPLNYVLQQSNKAQPQLICRKCGAFPPILSNQDVIEEKQRLKHAQYNVLPSCSDPKCDNYQASVLTHRHLYHAFGFSGERQRYRCKCCQQTFVDPWSSANHKQPFQQKLLALLFTGYNVREICRRLAINPKTFYDQLDHIAARCRRQLTIFDAQLVKQHSTLHLATDLTPLQPQSDNGVLWIATTEALSGYVVAQHVNYQTQAPTNLISEHDAYHVGTRFMTIPSSKYQPQKKIVSQGLLAQIDATYRQILARKNMENPLSGKITINYPTKGCLIRPQYTVYGHYLYLQELLKQQASLSLYMPQETLLRSACISVFMERIKHQTIDPLYVEDNGWQTNQPINKIDIVLMGWWRDRWAFARNDNNSKGICHLAGQKKQDHKWLTLASYQTASQFQNHFRIQFNHFVNEPRRKLRPAGLLPLLDIYRAWHNLCHQNKNGQTPAQQLKLMQQPMTLEQLLR